jgi:hypothetical protein
MPKYPDVKVRLAGEDGNAFAIIGRVSRALDRAGIEPSEVKQYQDEATSGDYDNVIQTSMRWVEVS